MLKTIYSAIKSELNHNPEASYDSRTRELTQITMNLHNSTANYISILDKSAVDFIHFMLLHGIKVDELSNRYYSDNNIILEEILNSPGDNRHVALLFIKSGFDINKVDKNGMTPLCYALKQKQYKLFDFLLEQEDLDLHALSKGCGIFSQATTLHLAAFNNDAIATKKLLASNSDPNARNTYELKTPLHMNAITYKTGVLQKFEVLDLLLQNRADSNAQDKFGNTPLHEAVLNRDPEEFKKLIECKALINKQNIYGQTVLHKVLWYCSAHPEQEKIIKLLLAHKADVNKKDTLLNETPLHLAAKNTDAKHVQMILDAKADVNCKNKSSQTPLDCAQEKNNHEVVELLTRII